MSAEFAKAYDKATVRTSEAADTHQQEKKKKEKEKNKKHDFRELSQDTKYSQFRLVRNSGYRDKVCLLTKIIVKEKNMKSPKTLKFQQ